MGSERILAAARGAPGRNLTKPPSRGNRCFGDCGILLLLLGLPLKKQIATVRALGGQPRKVWKRWRGEGGVPRRPEEDPAFSTTFPRPSLRSLSLSLPPAPTPSVSSPRQLKSKEETEKSALPEGATVWMGWGRRGRGWAAAPTP